MDDIHPNNRGVPSYAAVANPDVSTHVHHEHAFPSQEGHKHDYDKLVAVLANSTPASDQNDEDAGLALVAWDCDDAEDGVSESHMTEDGHDGDEGLGESTVEATKEPGPPISPGPSPPIARTKMEPTEGTKSPRELNEVKSSEARPRNKTRRSTKSTKGTKGRTMLEKHCDFFDPDGDRVIWPWDTFFGFWVLGYNLLLCLFAMFVIHGGFSWPTAPHFPLPDLFFRIYIDRIAVGKHGSDSGSYNHDGGFDEDAFEQMFKKNAKRQPDALTGRELFALIRRNRVLYDPFGWFAGLFEWVAVYLLFWPADNLIRKDDIRRLYDGTLFYEFARKEKKNGRLTPPGWGATVNGSKME